MATYLDSFINAYCFAVMAFLLLRLLFTPIRNNTQLFLKRANTCMLIVLPILTIWTLINVVGQDESRGDWQLFIRYRLLFMLPVYGPPVLILLILGGFLLMHKNRSNPWLTFCVAFILISVSSEIVMKKIWSLYSRDYIPSGWSIQHLVNLQAIGFYAMLGALYFAACYRYHWQPQQPAK